MKKMWCIFVATWLVFSSLTSCQVDEEIPSAADTESVVSVPHETVCEEATTSQSSNITPEGVPMETISYYQNPLLTAQTEFAWPNYGFGDPFVMRYNGVYYLYVSTKDGSVGIKCWSSTDLVHWKSEGFCSNDPLTRGAYAPEVYYYNGYFYMYTSPAGNGHYVLRSTSPTHGFEVVTDNLGMSIDGSVFVDNDGKWYFYTAGDGAMKVYDMTSPTQMSNGRSLRSISVNGGWTEGGMVVYHDGYYYLTYTGNHVLSPSYRILYGVSDRSPVAFDAVTQYNPLLISTGESIKGIGHSSTVKGPDLDSYYIVYHSLVNTTPNRNMNIDRIVFDGQRMEILGPTTTPQQVPEMPDVYHYFTPGSSLKGWTLQGDLGASKDGLCLHSDSKLYAKTFFEGDFTAEYHVISVPSEGRAGALFAYTDEDNFGACYFSPSEQKVVIEVTVGGEVTTMQVDTVRSFGENTRFDVLQSIQIERNGNDYTFYMNDRLLCTLKDSPLTGGAIGYVTQGGEACFGFIGGTGAVGGRGSADMFKSVNDQNGTIPVFEAMGTPDVVILEDGHRAVTMHPQEQLSYGILVAENGAYDLSITTEKGNSWIDIQIDGVSVGRAEVFSSTDLRHTTILRNISLEKGQHILTLVAAEEDICLSGLSILANTPVEDFGLNFDGDADGHIFSDGAWRIANGKLILLDANPYGKRLYGSPNMGDYTVEVEVTPLASPNCGLLLRVTNPGTPNFLGTNPTSDDAKTATDWVKGYFVGLTADGVVLGKQSYSYVEIARGDGTFKRGATYHLKAVCKGANIKVYVDDILYIDYTDPNPFLQGMVGVRTHNCPVRFDELIWRGFALP